MERIRLLALLVQFVTPAPSTSFNATQLLVDAHINPGQLTLARRSPDYIGSGLTPQWENLGTLYNKYMQAGRLDTAEMREFGTARKLLQLAQIVREIQTNQYLFERYCFYGCHCIPGYPVHDGTAGKGAPQDGIDHTCSKLRQCYLCAKNEEGDCDGVTMSYSWTFLDNDNDGRNDDIQCNNQVNSCRWKLCQCDRQFALNLRQHEEEYDEDYSEDKGFDRDAVCTGNPGQVPIQKCCGNYSNSFRLVYNSRYQDCCSDVRGDIRPIGECEI